jgi:hypothetical protein
MSQTIFRENVPFNWEAVEISLVYSVHVAMLAESIQLYFDKLIFFQQTQFTVVQINLYIASTSFYKKLYWTIYWLRFFSQQHLIHEHNWFRKDIRINILKNPINPPRSPIYSYPTHSVCFCIGYLSLKV